jgi:hypothetical protein
MYRAKFDMFVTSLKNRNVFANLTAEPIVMKLYERLRQRLNAMGFGNTVIDVMRKIPSIELETHELNYLRHNRFFISEHYLSRDIVLTTENEKTILRRFTAPYRTRPSLDAYQYCEMGKSPMFHVMFIGGTNTGKTAIMNEFKLMLRELVPEIEIIECDNDIKHPDNWDVTSDPVYYADYLERIKANGICIGNGPQFGVGVDSEIFHNTKI